MKLLVCLACATIVQTAALRAQSPVSLVVSNAPGYAIPDDFCGLSFGAVAELPGHGGVPGRFFSPTNTELITLFQNSGLHNLRLGGSTVEGLHAAVPSHADIDSVFGFARAAGVRVIYSLPLLNGNRATDAATAQYIWRRYRPLLVCFAIGNEPDIKRYHYPPFGTGTDPVMTNYASYLAAWKEFAAAVTNAVPEATFAGPDAAGRVWAPLFARDENRSGRVVLITQHFYVGGRPYIGEGPQTIPVARAIDNMLSTNWVAARYPSIYHQTLVPVMAAGLPYRMTESNDYLKGIANASDSFASALWALDYLHWWAAHGCSGVNFHNTEWLKTDTVYFDALSRSCLINPKACGIRAFDLGGHGCVEPVTVSNPSGLDLTAYAVGSTASLFVTIINKEHGAGARDAVVTILPRGFAAKSVSVMFLLAPHGDAGATNGITLGGAVITNHTVWRGKWTPLKLDQPGQCVVNVPAAAAAILKISAR